MPRFEPFPGLRYEPSVPLDEVVSPPYDVVGEPERAKLASRHPANAIHVELPAPAGDPGKRLDRYGAAAALLADWIAKHILVRDVRPCFYTYRMTEPDGSSTTGVLGALGCDPDGKDVLPHEQTIPKDMTDRLELLRACHANTSPIWGLSLSEGVATTYAPSGRAHATATDDDGVLHELWVIDDKRTIETIERSVAAAPVVIADGHHRYQTALAYRRERREADGDRPGEYDLVMALIVELAEDQLSVRAIHRVVRGIDPLLAAEGFDRWFEREELGGLGGTDPGAVDDLIERRALVLATDKTIWRLEPRQAALLATGSDLDSSLVGLVLDELGAEVGYVHDAYEAMADLESGAVDAVLLLRPVSVAQISDWAHAGRRMPPKSTYFHPKPRTGMVFRPLSD